MKRYLFTIAIMSIIPSFAFAAWWNPTTWFVAQSNTTSNVESDQVSSLKSIIVNKDNLIAQLQAELASSTQQPQATQQKVGTQAITVKDPSEAVQIKNLTDQLARLQTRYALCKGQLDNASSNTVQTTSDSTEINNIKKELGILTQIDFYIDNAPLQVVPGTYQYNSIVGTTTLIDILNNSKKLDGTMLFNNTLGQWYVARPNGSTEPTLQPTTSSSTLHQIVQSYRIQLEGQLEALGGVNQNRNVTQ